MYTRYLRAGGRALAVVLLGALAVGALLDQPVFVGYVETGSMAPTLAAGDGFVAVPAALSGGVSTGDVVVFESETLGGGGLTTHRVVAETDRGYVTKGDANPFTDQDGGEPVVTEGQIVATALEVGDEVVVIPRLGTAVETVQSTIATAQARIAVALGVSFRGVRGPVFLLFALSAVAYVADVCWGEENGRDRGREPDRDRGLPVHLVAGGLTLLVVLGATAAMVVPSGTQGYAVVSSEFEADDPPVIERGTSADVRYPVPNTGLVPVYSYVEPAGPGVAVAPGSVQVGARDDESVTVTLTAPEETGYYPTSVRERRYLAVLPKPVIDALYDAHPWAPIVAIDALLGALTYAIGRRFFGGRARIRSVSRSNGGRGSLGTLRRLYE